MRSHLRQIAVALVVMLLSPASLRPALAQDGVDGNSYVSPTYGYQLSWDESWEAVEESSEGGYDLLYLSNGTSDFYLEGYIGFDGEPAACLEGNREQLTENAGDRSADILTNDDGEPVEGEEEGVAYALYELTDEESEATYAAYVECRTLEEGASVIVITFITPVDDLQDQIGPFEEMLETLTLGEPTAATEDLPALLVNVSEDLTSFWTETLEEQGVEYVAPTYVFFDETIETDCGEAEPGEVGPFYCPVDQTIYMDYPVTEQAILPLGSFVVAVVIAHETGHHLQEVLGLEGCDDRGCGRQGRSLAIELQADCLAGAWAKDAGSRGLVQAGDVEQTIVAISEYFGDPPGTEANDPEAHGPGALRTWWFLKGYYDGLPECLTEEDSE